MAANKSVTQDVISTTDAERFDEEVARLTVIVTRDVRGEEEVGPPEVLRTLRPEDVLPIRDIRNYRGRSSILGYTRFDPSGRRVAVESVLEGTCVRLVAREGEVVDVCEQAVEILFPDGRRHVVDFLCVTGDGRTILIDVTTWEAAQQEDKAWKLAATAFVCAYAGVEYRVMYELAGRVRANLEWLAARRLPSLQFDEHARRLLAECDRPRRLGDLLALDPNPFFVAALFRLLSIGVLVFDLEAPLNEDTIVRRADSAPPDGALVPADPNPAPIQPPPCAAELVGA